MEAKERIDRLTDQLKEAGYRVKLDDRDTLSPGFKFNDWELKGVPVRLEIGPRDLENGQCVLFRRDTYEKQTAKLDELTTAIPALLDDIQKTMYQLALNFQQAHIHEVHNMDELGKVVDGGFAKATSIPCSPASPMYDETLEEQYDYAPEKFREAVQSSGVTSATEFAEYTGSILVNSEDPARVEVAQRIADVLNEAGVRVEVHKYSRSNFSYMVQQGDYDMYLGQVRLTANFDLTAFFSQYGYMNPGEMTTDDALLSMCTQALANSGNFSALCAQVVQRAQICPIAFRSYAIYVSRGMISAIEPGVDYVFRDPANVRLLADADETKLPEPTDTTEPTDDTTGDEPTDATDQTAGGQSAEDAVDPNNG